MIEHEQHCDDASLDVLLFGDEQTAKYREYASHVDSCPHCQERLTQLAAEDPMWSEAGEYLNETLDGIRGTESRWESAVQPAAIARQLECLSPASHPEMLGRLGRYEIERVIGTGGMGIVLKGYDTELNRPVAVKLLASHLAHSGAARQRFARESRAAAAIVHEHVVSIHNVETDGETPFLVMQYVAGESLQARVDREGPLDAIEILRIGAQAAAGLAAAHEQGVVHRDIKPANILLEEDVERTLLTDFGLARTVDDASLTHTGIVAGTPHYMSPEQASGEAIDHRTDLFGLGAVLYFMATGRPPFRADKAMGVLNRICNDRHRPVWEVNPNVPDELSDVIDRLLEKRPGRRFADASQVRQALLRSLERVQRGGPSQAIRLRRSFRRHRVWLIPTTMAVLCGLVGLLAMRPSAERPFPSKAAPNVRLSTGSVNDTVRFEASEYSATFDDVQQRLARLEATDDSTYLHVPGSDWDGEMQSIHAVLERLSDNPGTNPGAFE